MAKKSKSDTCKHDWEELGTLGASALSDLQLDFTDEDITMYRCTVCHNIRILTDITQKDVTQELGGNLIEVMKDNPDTNWSKPVFQ